MERKRINVQHINVDKLECAFIFERN